MNSTGLTSLRACIIWICAAPCSTRGKDFLLEQTLDGMFLYIECWMPSLKVFHNSSIEEPLTEFMIESESLHMSSWILSKLALEKI